MSNATDNPASIHIDFRFPGAGRIGENLNGRLVGTLKNGRGIYIVERLEEVITELGPRGAHVPHLIRRRTFTKGTKGYEKAVRISRSEAAGATFTCLKALAMAREL